MSTDERPLSPHLQVYRFEWTMAYSIVHRITGVGLSLGAVLLVVWLMALATGPDAFDAVQAFIGSWFGRLLLLGFTWALFYHFCNGIRHMLWDVGFGFEIGTAAKTGHTIAVSSVVLTLLCWIVGYGLLGG